MNSNFSKNPISHLVDDIEQALIRDRKNEAIIRKIVKIVEFVKVHSTTLESDEKLATKVELDEVLEWNNFKLCTTEEAMVFLPVLIEELKKALIRQAKNSNCMGWPFLCYYRIVKVMKILGVEIQKDFSPQIRLCYFVDVSFPETMSQEEIEQEIEIWDKCQFKTGEKYGRGLSKSIVQKIIEK